MRAGGMCSSSQSDKWSEGGLGEGRGLRGPGIGPRGHVDSCVSAERGAGVNSVKDVPLGADLVKV